MRAWPARGHDRRIDVHRDQLAAGARRLLVGQFLGPLPGSGPGCADDLQRPRRVRGQAGDQSHNQATRILSCRADLPDPLQLSFDF